MDKPVFSIEMPDLSYEQVVGIEDFLHAIMNAFENHYIHQLREYYRQLELDDDIDIDDIIDDLF